MHTGFLVFILAGLGYAAYSLIAGSPARASYRKGVEFLRDKKFIDAEHFLNQALEIDPLHIPSMRELAGLYESQGLMDKTVSLLGKMLLTYEDIFQDEAMDTNFRLGQIHYAAGRYKEAWRIYLLLLKQGYKEGELSYCLGELYMVQRRYGEAVNHFNDSLEMEPGQSKALYYKGLSLIAMKERKDAFSTLKKLENDAEFGSQVLFLLGKMSFDSGYLEDAGSFFGKLLAEKSPLFLKDLLLFKGYQILLQDSPSEEDLFKVIQYFNRGSHMNLSDTEVKKEFLFHLAGAHILLDQLNEAKTVLRDLCRLDSYYKHGDQILRLISKAIVTKGGHQEIVNRYKGFQKTMHYEHEVSQSLRIEEFFPHNFPVLVLEKLEEQVSREISKLLRSNDCLAAKLDLDTPRTPVEFSSATYDVFVDICGEVVKKLGIVVARNISKSRHEALYLGVDKDDVKTLVYCFKPGAVLGTVAMNDLLDRRDRYDADRLTVVCPGDFTDEARELAKDNEVHLFCKRELQKLL